MTDRPAPDDTDGTCQHCGGEGCKACDARFLADSADTPEPTDDPRDRIGELRDACNALMKHTDLPVDVERVVRAAVRMVPEFDADAVRPADTLEPVLTSPCVVCGEHVPIDVSELHECPVGPPEPTDDFREDDARVMRENGLTYTGKLAVPAEPAQWTDIVFDGPPGPESGRFVEVENERRESIRFGRWVERDDGYWCLRLNGSAAPDLPDSWPDPHAFIVELREALGLFAGAMPISPKAAWDEAIAEVRALRATTDRTPDGPFDPIHSDQEKWR